MGLKNSEDLENLSLRFSCQALGGQSLKAFGMEEKREQLVFMYFGLSSRYVSS